MLKFESKNELCDYYVPENQLKYFAVSKIRAKDKYSLRIFFHVAVPIHITGV